MNQIIDVIMNGAWWQSILTIIGIVIIIRFILEILFDRG